MSARTDEWEAALEAGAYDRPSKRQLLAALREAEDEATELRVRLDRQARSITELQDALVLYTSAELRAEEQGAEA